MKSKTNRGKPKRDSRKRDPAIDMYLANVPASNRALLQSLRKTIHDILPEVEEFINCRVPAFRREGMIIAGFAATSKEMSVPVDATYHHLAPKDLPLMRGLNRVFAEAFDDAETYLGAAPLDAYLTGFLAKPHVIALVARKQDEVVGGLVAYVLEKFERQRSEVYIYDLAVAAARRRQWIAQRLIKMLAELASEQGAYVVFVQADYGDEPAIRLYESLGAREEVLHFDIPVKPS